VAGEGTLQIPLGVAAEGGEALIEGDILQLVDAGEEAHLAELGNPGHEDEVNRAILPLHHRVEILQPLAHLGGLLWMLDVVEDRFIILINQHHHPLAIAGLGLTNQILQTTGEIGSRLARDPQALLIMPQQGLDAESELLTALHHPAGEVEQNHRIGDRPIPLRVERKATKQLFVTLKQLFEGIDQQAFAEAAGTGEEPAALPLGQAVDLLALIHIEVAALNNRGQVTNPYRQRDGHTQ